MADYVATTEDFKTVANAIRTKGGTSAPLSFPDEFASAIQAIAGPKPEQEKEVTITENGDYPITADVGKVLSKVLAHVNVSGGGGGDSNIKSGSFTISQSIVPTHTDPITINHSLGKIPNVFVVWSPIRKVYNNAQYGFNGLLCWEQKGVRQFVELYSQQNRWWSMESADVKGDMTAGLDMFDSYVGNATNQSISFHLGEKIGLDDASTFYWVVARI